MDRIPIPRETADETRGTGLISALIEQRVAAFYAAILLVVAIAWLDHLTGPLLTLSALYLLPVGTAAWTGGRVAGLVAAAAASTCALMANRSAESLVGTSIPYWNAMVRFAIFAFATLAIVKLRDILLLERRRARTDSLTKIPNSRAFFEAAEAELNRCSRFGRPFSVAYLDVDDFKGINDRMGHSIGDQVLKELAALIDANTRASDTFARLGGDEFVLLLPETDHRHAADAVTKLSSLLESFSVSGHPVSVSMGTTTFLQAPGSVDDLIRRADDLMYSAKRSRRAQAAGTQS